MRRMRIAIVLMLVLVLVLRIFDVPERMRHRAVLKEHDCQCKQQAGKHVTHGRPGEPLQQETKRP